MTLKELYDVTPNTSKMIIILTSQMFGNKNINPPLSEMSGYSVKTICPKDNGLMIYVTKKCFP